MDIVVEIPKSLPSDYYILVQNFKIYNRTHMEKSSAYPDMKKNILVFSIINFVIYVLLFILFRSLNLLHLSGLRMLNYVTLGIVSCYQIDRWTKRGGPYLPFLKAFLRASITGTISFIFFAIFIFIYAKTDPYFTSLYFDDSHTTNKFIPFIIIFFEGSAGSVIVGLIVGIYSEKYTAKPSTGSRKG